MATENLTEKNKNWEDGHQFWETKNAEYIEQTGKIAKFNVPYSENDWKFYGSKVALPFEPKTRTYVEMKIEFSVKPDVDPWDSSMMIGLVTQEASLWPLDTKFGILDGQTHLLKTTGFVQDENGHYKNYTPSFDDKNSYIIGVLYDDFEKTVGYSLDNEYLGVIPGSLRIEPPYYLAVCGGSRTQFTAEIVRCIHTSIPPCFSMFIPGIYSPIADWAVDMSTGKPVTKWESQSRAYQEECESIIGDLKKEWNWIKKEESGKITFTDKLISDRAHVAGRDYARGPAFTGHSKVLHAWSMNVHTPNLASGFAVGVGEETIAPKHITTYQARNMHLLENGDFWLVSNDEWESEKGEYRTRCKKSQVCTRNYEITVVFNEEAGRLALYSSGKSMCEPLKNVFSENPLCPLILYGGPQMEITLNWTANIPMTNSKARAYFRDAFPDNQKAFPLLKFWQYFSFLKLW